MTAIVKFDNSCIFEGFTVSYKINEDLSKTFLIAETYKKLDGVLESLNLHKLRSILKDECFVVQQSLVGIQEDDVISISAVKLS